MKRIYVLDVSGLVNPPMDGESYTTPEIIEEISEELKKSVVKTRVKSGEVKVKKPKSRYLRIALREAKETGDLEVLSKADLSILALALELREIDKEIIVLTDDFALQNIFIKLGIDTKPIFGKKIEKVIMWKRICPICRTEYPADYPSDFCPECGIKLTRKAFLKMSVNELRGQSSI
ncbi:ribonuclease VapC [Candidatus Geothermarchaeota archaeon]|nr:MAG: ribonuclease VapC [Candidatus Geothermarchaeota archaeon]